MSDFEAENRELRQQLKGLDECMSAFVEASEGVIAELDAFCDACSSDPALHERARTAASAAGEHMHAVIDTVGRRFATYRALNPVPPSAEGPDFTTAQGE